MLKINILAMEKNSIISTLTITLILGAFSDIRSAQISQTCLNELGPCLNYLNGTRDPPDICCYPLKKVIESDPECLCGLISNQGAIQAQLMGINVTEAQELPGRCGQRVNPLACLSSSPNSRNSDGDSSNVIIHFPSLIKLMASVALSMIIPTLLH